MAKIMVDPPSGWKYGFPKEFDSEKDGDMMSWIVNEGYPKDELEKLGEHFYLRCWESQTNNESEFKKGIFLAEGNK